VGSNDVAISAPTAPTAHKAIAELINALAQLVSDNPETSLQKATAPTSFEVGAALPRDRIEPPTRGFSESNQGCRNVA
jgi:hypothetical protein